MDVSQHAQQRLASELEAARRQSEEAQLAVSNGLIKERDLERTVSSLTQQLDEFKRVHGNDVAEWKHKAQTAESLRQAALDENARRISSELTNLQGLEAQFQQEHARVRMECSQRIEGMIERERAAQSHARSAEDALRQSTLVVTKLESDLSHGQSVHEALRNDIWMRDKEVASLKDRLDVLKIQHDEHMAEREQLYGQLKAKEEQLLAMQHQVEEIRSDASSPESVGLDSQMFEQLTQQCHTLQNTVRVISQQRDELQQELAHMQQQQRTPISFPPPFAIAPMPETVTIPTASLASTSAATSASLASSAGPSPAPATAVSVTTASSASQEPAAAATGSARSAGNSTGFIPLIVLEDGAGRLRGQASGMRCGRRCRYGSKISAGDRVEYMLRQWLERLWQLI